VLPFHCDLGSPRTLLTDHLLEVEYGSEIICCLRQLVPSKTVKQHLQRQQQKNIALHNAAHRQQHIISNWPTVVSEDIIFNCLRDYYIGTVWKSPAICCVCGLLRQKMVDVPVSGKNCSSLNLSILQVKDHLITDVSAFRYGLSALDDVMLESAGFKTSDKGKNVMQICNDCHCALMQCQVPRLTLANYLY
jgi:hypothetical protein